MVGAGGVFGRRLAEGLGCGLWVRVSGFLPDGPVQRDNMVLGRPSWAV